MSFIATHPAIDLTEDGKFRLKRPICTARAKSGRIITGRPETVAALTGDAKPYNFDQVVQYFETREEADAQL